MAGLDFEGAIVRPKVHRVGDARYTSFVNLRMSASCLKWFQCGSAYQLRSLSPRDGEFKVCIFLPVSK